MRLVYQSDWRLLIVDCWCIILIGDELMSIGWLLWQPGLTITPGKSSLFKYKENIRPMKLVGGKLQQKQLNKICPPNKDVS